MNQVEFTRRVREILLRDWDPCGVGDNEALGDEYDRYVPAIARLLVRRISAEVVTNALVEIESELGVSLPAQERELAVRALLAILV